jgi:hypothetical protein
MGAESARVARTRVTIAVVFILSFDECCLKWLWNFGTVVERFPRLYTPPISSHHRIITPNLGVSGRIIEAGHLRKAGVVVVQLVRRNIRRV